MGAPERRTSKATLRTTILLVSGRPDLRLPPAAAADAAGAKYACDARQWSHVESLMRCYARPQARWSGTSTGCPAAMAAAKRLYRRAQPPQCCPRTPPRTHTCRLLLRQLQHQLVAVQAAALQRLDRRLQGGQGGGAAIH